MTDAIEARIVAWLAEPGRQPLQGVTKVALRRLIDEIVALCDGGALLADAERRHRARVSALEAKHRRQIMACAPDAIEQRWRARLARAERQYRRQLKAVTPDQQRIHYEAQIQALRKDYEHRLSRAQAETARLRARVGALEAPQERVGVPRRLDTLPLFKELRDRAARVPPTSGRLREFSEWVRDKAIAAMRLHGDRHGPDTRHGPNAQ